MLKKITVRGVRAMMLFLYWIATALPRLAMTSEGTNGNDERGDDARAVRGMAIKKLNYFVFSSFLRLKNIS